MRGDTPSVLAFPETRRYLDETVRVWLGLRARGGLEAPELPDDLARRLLRLEEHESDRRDSWGRWEPDCSEDSAASEQRIPEIDRWVAERRAELATTSALEPLWPEGLRSAVCLTHDVDVLSPQSTPRQIARYARAGLARASSAGRRLELLRFARPPVRVGRSLRSGVARVPQTRDTIERSVELETEHGAVSSYLFTVPPAGDRSRYDCSYTTADPCLFRGERRRLAEVVRLLAGEGFDIGLHGSYHAGTQPGALAAERAALEEATGLEISTTRQHLLHWDVRWTPALQAEAGLLVDSSLGFNRTVGFRAGTSLPFRQFDVQARRRLELLEVPLVVQDVALLGAWGLDLDTWGAFEVIQQLLDSALKLGGAITLVFHPDKLVHRDWAALYELTLDYAAAQGAWLTSLGRLASWWRAREAGLLGA